MIAIIGQSARLPGRVDSRFWSALKAGESLLSQVDSGRWAQSAYLHPLRSHPGTSVTFAAGSLGDVAGFDAAFFRISPREAAAMDPQQRLLLEMTWEALVQAGQPIRNLRGSSTGVFLGLASTDYGYRFADDLAALGPNSATGVTASIAANRISYVFDWRGPSLVIDTACSSGLVAFHQACESLLREECELALTGAINLHLHPFGFLIFSKASMLSASGRSRPFQEGADGYVRSEGGGVFLLKTLERARRDGDPILAVVLGTGNNTDGHKHGLTVPSAMAQAALLEQVYARVGFDPQDLAYVEAHGTGTAVGDPIELEAIGKALTLSREQPLPVGSVKSNLGHLETASAVPGLLKAILSLRERQIPPTIGIETLNPKLPLDRYPLEIVHELRPLPARGTLTVGVNSFGFGGANAHAILQTPPRWRTVRPKTPPSISVPVRRPLLLSAANEAALRVWAKTLAEFLEPLSSRDWERALYQLNFRHPQLEQGIILWFAEQAELLTQLHQVASEAGPTSETTLSHWYQPEAPITVGFVYSGNGCQWSGMGRDLLMDPEVAAIIQEIDRTFAPLAGYRLLDDLLGESSADRYDRTIYAQPALFALQVGQTVWLRSHGIEASGVVGHSVGEVAAAWACGALSLADATRVIHVRSLAQERTRGLGQMTALGCSVQVISERLQQGTLTTGIWVAADNSPKGCTVVGNQESLAVLERELRSDGVLCKRLPINYPFHGPDMDSLRDEILAVLSDLTPQPNSIPFYSTVAEANFPGEKLDAEYWWKNIREPVHFRKAAGLLTERCDVVIELGGHPVLRSYLRDIYESLGKSGRILNSLRREESEQRAVLQQMLDSLWLSGYPRNWDAFYPESLPPLELPNYPWQRERHWHEPTAESCALLYRYERHPLLGHPLAGHPGFWEQRLDTASHVWLADHQVGGEVLFPGAGFVELVLALGRQQFPEARALCIEDLEILAPLVLEAEQSRILRTQWLDGRVRVSSRKEMQEPWTEHLRARLRVQTRSAPLPLTSLPDRDRQYFSASTHYQWAARLGLQYGPCFQTVEGGHCDTRGVDAKLHSSLTVGLQSQLSVDPGILDGALQLFIDLLADESSVQATAFVPVRVERLDWWADSVDISEARVRLLRRSPHSLLGQLQLLSRSGQVALHAQGVRLQELRLPGKQQLSSPRYFAQRLLPMERADAKSRLEYSVLQDLCTEYLTNHPILQRRRQEFLPLLQSYLQMDEESQAARLWQTLLLDYPESQAWTLAAGRLRLRRQCQGEGEKSVLSSEWWRQDLQIYLRGMAQVLGSFLQQGNDPNRPWSVAECSDAGWELLPLLDASTFRRCGLRPATLEDERVDWPVHPLARLPENLGVFDLLLVHLDPLKLEVWETLLQRGRTLLRPGGVLVFAGTSPLRGDLLSEFPVSPTQMLENAGTPDWAGSLLRPDPQEPAWFLLLRALPRDRFSSPDSVLLLSQTSGPFCDSLREEGVRVQHILPREFSALHCKSQENTVAVYIPELIPSGNSSPSSAIIPALMELRDVLRVCKEARRQLRVDLILPGAFRPRNKPTDIQAAALAAFIKTLANEWPDLSLRVLDVSAGFETPFPVLAKEILHCDGETELRFEANGQRLAIRVDELSGRVGNENQPIQLLTNSRAGQLRYLAWKPLASLVDLPAGRVEVETVAAGLNFRDVMYALGLVGDEALEAGFSGPGLGLEFAGTVLRVGPEVSRWRVGDRVLGFGSHSLANRVVTAEYALAAIPDNLDWISAAGLPTAFFTAWYSLINLGRLEAGEKVLIHGAAGAVGLAAIQIAQRQGADIFATAGTAAKRDFLRLLGVRHLYDSRTLDFADAILADTQGQGVDVVLNSLAGEAMERSLRLLKPFGRFLELGKRDFYGDTLLGLRPMRNNLSYFGIDADQLLSLLPQTAQQNFEQLIRAFEREELFPLPSTVFPSHAAPDAFRYMQQSRQIGKIVIDTRGPFLPCVSRTPITPAPLQLDSETVYVITGGTSGFGWQTARRLIERGARNLALLSRQGKLSRAAEEFLRQQDNHAEVRVHAVDVADRTALSDVFCEIAAWGPIRGIIHAAAVIEDALTEQLSPEKLRAVLAPKIDGAWHLHELSESQPLDFFVLYSSISNLLGNVGQGAYVAANGAMEALIRGRHAVGLPGTVLQFGPIADAGYLTRHGDTQNLLQRRLGGRAISSAQALDTLEWALDQGLSQIAVADLRWNVLRESLPWVRGTQFQTLDWEHSTPGTSSGSTDWRARLAELDEVEALKQLQSWIAAEVGQILRLPPKQIDPRKKLTDLGFDSLMGMELAMALEERSGLKVPSFVLSEEPTIYALSQRLLGEWQDGDSHDSGDAAALDHLAHRHGVSEEYRQRIGREA